MDPEVRNLAQVKAGDKVVVSYYQALAAEVKKPGEGVKGVEADVSSARRRLATSRPRGGRDAAHDRHDRVGGHDVNTVSFKRSDGQSRTVTVQSPEGKEFIRGLKKGDQVEIAYTEALAMEVKPAG